jgi:hypothetical protein
VAIQNPEIARAVIAVANAHQGKSPDPEKIAKARADLAAAKIKAYIEKTLAAAPPISDEQRARLARLLIMDEGQR